MTQLRFNGELSTQHLGTLTHVLQSQPPITGTTHTLPFDKLSPRDFERLCLWLVEREGYERAEHLGAAGSEQGRDLIAWRGARLQTLIASVA